MSLKRALPLLCRLSGCVAVSLTLIGCDGGRDDGRSLPATGSSVAGAAGFDAAVADAAASVAVAQPGTAAAPLPAVAASLRAFVPTFLPVLVQVGEIVLPGGEVQAVYRLRFDNGAMHAFGMVAELVSAGPNVRVIEGRVSVGDLAPGAAASPADTVTLQHAAHAVIEPASLHWRWTAGKPLDHRGVLLPGAAEIRADAAVHDFEVTTAPARELQAVLAPGVRVAQVNAALQAGQVRIVQMRRGSRLLTLRQMPGGDEQMRRRLEESLRTSGAFEIVRPVSRIAAAAGASDSVVAPDTWVDLPEADPEPAFNDHRDQ